MSAESSDQSESNELGYADALAELDAILAELESGDVDVDRLADQVSRAAELIAFCRGRIDRARVTIEQVVVDLDSPDDGRPVGGDSDR